MGLEERDPRAQNCGSITQIFLIPEEERREVSCAGRVQRAETGDRWSRSLRACVCVRVCVCVCVCGKGTYECVSVLKV